MADKHLKLDAHIIRGNKHIWWYEEPKGISIVTDCHYEAIDTVYVPWSAIRAALRRKDAKC